MKHPHKLLLMAFCICWLNSSFGAKDCAHVNRVEVDLERQSASIEFKNTTVKNMTVSPI